LPEEVNFMRITVDFYEDGYEDLMYVKDMIDKKLCKERKGDDTIFLVTETIKHLSNKYGKEIPLHLIAGTAEGQGINAAEVRQAVEMLKSEGRLKELKANTYQATDALW